MAKYGRSLYAEIAHIIQGVATHEQGDPATVALSITALADFFEADNPRFNRDKFLRACGIEEVVL
jgi:hypothetical protein